MPRPIRRVWNFLHNRTPAGKQRILPNRYSRPFLESLEDRVTPTTTQNILATGVISGFVQASSGGIGVPGVVVTLTGDTTTGRTINVNTTTGANGAYTFNSLLPGTYSVTRGGDPNGFVGGDVTLLSNVQIGQGQSTSGNNLDVGGLAAPRISLAFFLSGANVPSISLPSAGAGNAAGFSLNSATAIAAVQFLSHGSTTFFDLSGNFFDPDTTDTTVTFNTSQGSFNVQLFDTDAPQTVTNFLDYIEAGDYTDGLFHRMSNLSQTTAQTPPITPFQVLQGGGFDVATDASNNLTGINTITTFQPIQNEFSNAHQNVVGTIAMARGSAPNSATSQFFFNLTDNSQALNSTNGGGFAVFGKVTDATGTTALQNFVTNYTPTNVSTATNNSALVTVPLINGFTPASNFPTGATTTDVALTNSITVATPSNGHLTYKVLSNSNPSVVTATLGQNTSTSTFSANQLQLVANAVGSSVITLQVSDARGETVITQFTVNVQ
jgi:cyclophilin family peptidyl-prolyl cis-trans isomerase